MPRPKKKQSLFGEDGGDAGGFGFNEGYAKKFEHNKQREEKHRLEAKYGRTVDDLAEDESSSEEEDNGHIPVKTEVQILDLLTRIKKKDPSIYKEEAKFFSDPEESDSEDGEPKKRKEKKLFLKDVVFKQAIEGAEAAGDSEEEEEEAPREPTYAEEQEALKRGFLTAAGDEEGTEAETWAGSGLQKRKLKDGEKATWDVDVSDIQASEKMKKRNAESLLQDYFGKANELDENDRFLRDYIATQGWVDEEEGQAPTYRAIVGDSEDEDAVERADHFEKEYNFRYEEEGSGHVATHSRDISDTVRKSESKRKRQRESKATREAEERKEREEEIKRMKNLKKKEVEDKLRKVRDLAHTSKEIFTAEDLERDFDPEEFDRRMQEVFDEEYYNEHDDELVDGEPEKPVFGDLEEELEAIKGGGGFEEVHKKLKARKAKGASSGAGDSDGSEGGGSGSDDSGPESGSEDEVDEAEGGRRQAVKDEVEKARQEIAKTLDEYYKLDFEDSVGGVNCRFKYRKVPKNDYGLSPDEVLGMADPELNSVVSLKKLAPYREDQGMSWKPPNWLLAKLRSDPSWRGVNSKGYAMGWKGHKGKNAGGKGGKGGKGAGDKPAGEGGGGGAPEKRRGGKGRSEGGAGAGGGGVVTEEDRAKRDEARAARDAARRMQSYENPLKIKKRKRDREGAGAGAGAEGGEKVDKGKKKRQKRAEKRAAAAAAAKK